MSPALTKQASLRPLFEAGFLDDHAGQIIRDPNVALVELVANAWDAGARTVRLIVPVDVGGSLSVEDNGTGMTRQEFQDRWLMLSYNRVEHQGRDVEYPPEITGPIRPAFGRNGKGRHAMFCFAPEYSVETWRDGASNSFVVKRSGAGQAPFSIEHVASAEKGGHGTIIRTVARSNFLSPDAARSLIASKFVSDPDFRILVNDQPVDLTDLDEMINTENVVVEGYGSLEIVGVDSQRSARTTQHHGVAYWVNRRLVGVPSWDRLDGTIIDGRTTEAKRYTFVVFADLLAPDVKQDWTGFHHSARYNAVRDAVDLKVAQILRTLRQDELKEKKKAALELHKDELRGLPTLSREVVGQ